MRRVALTTLDNPYDPIDQYREWYQFDEAAGYNSSAYLARIVNTTEEFGEILYMEQVEAAIDEIVALNLLGLYKKVVKVTEDA